MTRNKIGTVSAVVAVNALESDVITSLKMLPTSYKTHCLETSGPKTETRPRRWKSVSRPPRNRDVQDQDDTPDVIISAMNF
jgi:hypothetical protein